MKKYLDLDDKAEQELSGIAALTNHILSMPEIIRLGVVFVKIYVEKTMQGYELYFEKKDHPEEKIYITFGQDVDDYLKRHK